jgi:hypothetical protein
MKKSILLISAMFFLSGCAVTPQQKLQTSDTRECAKNFTYDGSFFAGRTFKTHQFVAGVSKNNAMARAARFLAVEGYSITSSDKEMGLISASQTVSYGKGKTVPLNVSILPKGKGVDVSTTFAISGGLTVPVNSVKDTFCEIIAAVQGKEN